MLGVFGARAKDVVSATNYMGPIFHMEGVWNGPQVAPLIKVSLHRGLGTHLNFYFAYPLLPFTKNVFPHCSSSGLF